MARTLRTHGLPIHIFRLAGIYGPGRNQLLSIRAGTARAIIKPGQVFSRIHVEDVAGVLEASITTPNPGRIYNVCDDEPAPPENVVAYAAELMSAPKPLQVDVALAGLTPMALSFYDDLNASPTAASRKSLAIGCFTRHTVKDLPP